MGVLGRLVGRSRLVGDPGIGDRPTFTGFRASVDNGALYFFKGVDVALRRTGLSTLDKRAVREDTSGVVRFGVNGAGLAVVLRGVLYIELVLVVMADVEYSVRSTLFNRGQSDSPGTH